jgi:predicted Rossmann fold flavoprotein
MHKKKIIVVGGGAAGFFGAISAKEHFPEAEVIILEKNRTVLNKVRISGGGRCNVTHACFDNKQLIKNYPRGSKFLSKVFAHFNAQSTVDWFHENKVNLKIEPDGRMFPMTNKSETIVECLEGKAQKLGIEILKSSGVKSITQNSDNQFIVSLLHDESFLADAVLITVGGFPNLSSYDWLAALGHTIVSPVPSLFTFNVPDSVFSALSGIAVEQSEARVAGTKIAQTGPSLVTHWGFSGPANLKLSAWAARELADKNYSFQLLINWLASENENSIRQIFEIEKKQNPKRTIHNYPIKNLPTRLWKLLCELSEISETLRWIDVSNRQVNKLIENLLNSAHKVEGKSTFKEEFVTCGGIELSEVNPETMESKIVKGLFFAGEVLDIDAVTGGYNFQAAWSMAYLAGKNILK